MGADRRCLVAGVESGSLPYAKPPSSRILVPISLYHDPMERLLVANFSDDPVYNGLEIQVYDDPAKGSGLALLMYRIDGKLDWYLTPGLTLDKEAAAVGSGLGEWVTQGFSGHLDIGADEVKAGVDLTLHDGVPLHFEMAEARRRGPGIDLLAPLGVGIEKPQFLPLFYMYGLDLVARRGSRVELSIGGEERKLDRVPVPIPYNGRFCYLMRHCADPFIVRINEADDPGWWVTPAEADALGCRFHERSGYSELEQMHVDAGGHTIWVRYDPPLPDLLALRGGSTVDGRMGIGADDALIIGARYTVRGGDDVTDMEVQPVDDWTPPGNTLVRLTLRMFPSFFRTWPKTYRWYGTVGSDGVVNSRWERAEA